MLYLILFGGSCSSDASGTDGDFGFGTLQWTVLEMWTANPVLCYHMCPAACKGHWQNNDLFSFWGAIHQHLGAPLYKRRLESKTPEVTVLCCGIPLRESKRGWIKAKNNDRGDKSQSSAACACVFPFPLLFLHSLKLEYPLEHKTVVSRISLALLLIVFLALKLFTSPACEWTNIIVFYFSAVS